MNRPVLIAAMAAAVTMGAADATPAHAASWKSCGKMSRKVNEGNNTATAKIAFKQSKMATITCRDAKLVARHVLKRGVATELGIEGRLWTLDLTRTGGPSVYYERGPYAVVRLKITTR